MKARVTYAHLGHLWCLLDVSHAVKCWVYDVAVRAALLYASETWPFQVEDVERFSVFKYRSTQKIADTQCQKHFTTAEIRRRVVGHNDDNLIRGTILKHRIR